MSHSRVFVAENTDDGRNARAHRSAFCREVIVIVNDYERGEVMAVEDGEGREEGMKGGLSV